MNRFPHVFGQVTCNLVQQLAQPACTVRTPGSTWWPRSSQGLTVRSGLIWTISRKMAEDASPTMTCWKFPESYFSIFPLKSSSLHVSCTFTQRAPNRSFLGHCFLAWNRGHHATIWGAGRDSCHGLPRKMMPGYRISGWYIPTTFIHDKRQKDDTVESVAIFAGLYFSVFFWGVTRLPSGNST